MTGWWARTAMEQLARRGFVVRRHPAARRQALLAEHGVDVVLDVGAAEGTFGAELRAFGYTGSIVSFEPLRAAHERLVARAGHDAAWQTRRVALGEVAGAATINVASNSDSSSLLPLASAHREAAPDIDYVATEEIEVRRLDDVASELLGPASRAFLKIDTQGFERQVLAGAAATLPRCAGVQLELSFAPLYEGGMLAPEAFAWAEAAGFRLAWLDTGFTAPDGRLLQADGAFLRV